MAEVNGVIQDAGMEYKSRRRTRGKARPEIRELDVSIMDKEEIYRRMEMNTLRERKPQALWEQAEIGKERKVRGKMQRRPDIPETDSLSSEVFPDLQTEGGASRQEFIKAASDAVGAIHKALVEVPSSDP
jgi:hypothetical protein